MDLNQFLEMIGRLTVDDLRTVAAAIEAEHGSAADEVDWWHATIAVDRVLKQTRTTRQAALAAMHASRGVLAVARAGGMVGTSPDVISVARAAGQVGRALAAGEAATGPAEYLLRAWASTMPASLVAA